MLAILLGHLTFAPHLFGRRPELLDRLVAVRVEVHGHRLGLDRVLRHRHFGLVGVLGLHLQLEVRELLLQALDAVEELIDLLRLLDHRVRLAGAFLAGSHSARRPLGVSGAPDRRARVLAKDVLGLLHERDLLLKVAALRHPGLAFGFLTSRGLSDLVRGPWLGLLGLLEDGGARV